jgi:hypothetical protein
LGAPASLGQGRRSLPVVEVDAALSVSGAPQPAWGGFPAAACGGGWTQLYLCLGRLSRLWGTSSVRSKSTALSGPVWPGGNVEPLDRLQDQVHRPLPRPSHPPFDELPNLASRPSLAILDKKEEEEEEGQIH